MRRSEQHDKEKELTKKIKKAADKDKEDYILETLKELLELKEKWRGIKNLKSNFVPNFIKINDIRGNRTPYGKRAHVIAEYLSEIQWKNNNETPDKTIYEKRKIVHEHFDELDLEISLEEIIEVIKHLNNNKAPGPDNCVTELFKWLDEPNLEILRKLLNECWRLEEVPDIFTYANVASLFKKGDTKNPASYRPISLLNTIYKFYAAIIQRRLASRIDKHINKTQYGFRKKRSTSHALFVARRIQDIFEESGDNVGLVLLDREKAFDKIDQKRLIEA